MGLRGAPPLWVAAGARLLVAIRRLPNARASLHYAGSGAALGCTVIDNSAMAYELADATRRMVATAEEEGRRHGWLGTEHLLLGLLRQPCQGRANSLSLG